MFSIIFISLSWLSLNSSRVCTSAVGKAATDCSRAAVASSFGSPDTFSSVNVLSWSANAPSNAAVEMDTSPKGDPPLGSSKTPSTCSRRSLPVGVFTVTGEPIFSEWSSA